MQGHVSFPLVLDLFPFTAAARDVQLGTSGETILERAEKQQPSAFVGHHLDMQRWLRALPCLDNLSEGDFSGESRTGNEVGSRARMSSDGGLKPGDASISERDPSEAPCSRSFEKVSSVDFAICQISIVLA